MDFLGKTVSLLEGLTLPRFFRWYAAMMLLATIGGVGLLVYFTGGIKYVYSHLMYLPVLFAAIFFGGRGGLAFGLLGGIVLGPWMPVNVETGEEQLAINWLFRIGVFVLVGTLFGATMSHLRRQLQRLRWSASHDAITGLPNKVSLFQELMARGAAKDSTFTTLAHIHLENYFEITNTLGMDAGETLARQVFTRIRNSTQEIDFVCQTHSDRFTVLLKSESRSQALAVLKKTLEVMKKSVMIEDIPVYADISIGFASQETGETSFMPLVQKANVALHAAQSKGQEISEYDPSIVPGKERISLVGEIPEAIEKNQLRLHYQPKVDLQTGRIVGVEALLRWHHPKRGPIPPGEFIFKIENTGLIHTITRWVTIHALEQLSSWRDKGLNLSMAINISTRNFLEADLLPFLRRQLEKFDIPAGMLELEITESAVMADAQNATALLRELKNLGLSISLDDFGTGHSSLAYLKQLPVDTVKIDQAFIRTLPTEPADVDMVRAMIFMSRNLGIKTVAEGIEDEETLSILKKVGCDIGQGYYFCRPRPAEEITPLLESGYEKLEDGAGLEMASP